MIEGFETAIVQSTATYNIYTLKLRIYRLRFILFDGSRLTFAAIFDELLEDERTSAIVQSASNNLQIVNLVQLGFIANARRK
jgi:hypothetical protein